MQANDVRVLKSAAIPTLAVGVVAVVVALLLSGAKGALGAAIGTVLVGVFFSISVVAVSYAARVSPQMMAIAAMGSYLIKIVVIMLMLAAFGDTTAWNPKAFAWSVVVGHARLDRRRGAGVHQDQNALCRPRSQAPRERWRMRPVKGWGPI